jgi:hypothetical protein
MGKPTEPQVSVTDTADIKVLSAAVPSWSVQTHDPTRMFPNPRNARRAPVGEQHRPPRCRRRHLAGLARLDQPSDLDRRSDPLGAGHRRSDAVVPYGRGRRRRPGRVLPHHRLRVLTLLEFRVRQRLADTQERLAGLYAGNPKRTTQRPTAEAVLGAFQGIHSSLVTVGQQLHRHLTPLSALQQCILSLLDFLPDLYHQFGADFPIPP